MEKLIEQEAEKLTNTTVLVVDDQPAILRLLKEALTLKGYQVLAAASVSRALEMAREKKPELIILDISIGGQSGFLAAENFKAFLPQAKIIFITAHSDEELLKKAQQIAQAVLVKPFGIEKLYQEVDKIAAKVIGDYV